METRHGVQPFMRGHTHKPVFVPLDVPEGTGTVTSSVMPMVGTIQIPTVDANNVSQCLPVGIVINAAVAVAAASASLTSICKKGGGMVHSMINYMWA